MYDVVSFRLRLQALMLLSWVNVQKQMNLLRSSVSQVVWSHLPAGRVEKSFSSVEPVLTGICQFLLICHPYCCYGNWPWRLLTGSNPESFPALSNLFRQVDLHCYDPSLTKRMGSGWQFSKFRIKLYYAQRVNFEKVLPIWQDLLKDRVSPVFSKQLQS